MDVIKSTQDNISAYLYNAINIEIYEEYESYKFKEQKEPLEFFNLLYSEFAFFNENIENYLAIKSHFDNYDSNSTYKKIESDTILLSNTSLLYKALVKLIKEHFPVKLREGVILKSCEHIESISDVLTRMEWGNANLMDDILNDIKEFDYSKKIESLIELKYLSLKNEAFFVDKKGVTIASKIDLEIEKLEKLKQLNDENTKGPEKLTTLNLSNSSAVEKIIYLNELGIIDLLRKEQCFLGSTNKLAVVLSAITGEKSATLQPILNPMLSKNTAQKNNPYSSKSNIEKIKSQLITLGIQSK